MRTSKIRALAVAVIALLTCLSVLAPDVADARRKRNKVTIVVNGGDFSGRVKHKKESCEVEREVFVFRQLGNTPDPTTDDEIASDTTDADGEWNTGNTGANNGQYYAHAPETAECKALTSKTATVTGRPGDDDEEN